MIDQEKALKMKTILDTTVSKLDEKERKGYRVDTLYKMIDKLDSLHDMNKGEINKLVMLLEYTIYSLEKQNEKEFLKRYKAVRGHLNKFFGVYAKGELVAMGTGIGLALGIGIGTALGVVTNNQALGVPIGLSVGLALGAGFGTQKEKKLEEEGKIL